MKLMRNEPFGSTNLPDESEATAFAREAVARYINIADLATSLEYASEIFRCCPVREIIDFQGNHPIDTRRRSAVTHLRFRY